MEIPIKMDDLGVPLFSETSTSKPFSNLDPNQETSLALGWSEHEGVSLWTPKSPPGS